MSKFKNLFLLFSLFLFAGLSLNTYAGPFATPDVTGGDEANAIAIINADDNFVVGTKSTGSDSTAAGTVFDQSPAAGSLEDTGTAINYVVSLGPVTTTTTTTAATTTTTAASTTTTTAGATTTTAAGTTTTTAAASTTTTVVIPTTTTTAAATTTTAAGTTTTAAATTTTTMGGGPTTTATPTTTTTTATTSTTGATTTTTLPPPSDEVELFDFGGSGCTISNTQSASMDPIWLFLLLVPGLGILRRRTAKTRS
jgi:hypothetical protein